MKDVTLVTVNWNQQPCVELLLKSYVRHHYKGEPLKLILVDNFSTDNSREWLEENEIPYIPLVKNEGHENALNRIYNLIDTEYCLLNDTDVEYKANVYGYLDEMKDECGSVGELIDGNYINDSKIVDRISPWFWIFRIALLRRWGFKEFRNPSNENWTYDVGSEHWEKMKEHGITNFNLKKKEGHQDNDLISMQYDKFNHWGKVSWNLKNHGDRYSEVMQRREAIKERLELYGGIDLKGKFV